jgi:hypothetical protein
MKLKFLKRLVFGCLLTLICLSQSGCEGLFDNCDEKDDAKYYESRGVSPNQAERAAYEDNFFDHMDQAANH